jgi:hypothetical protein
MSTIVINECGVLTILPMEVSCNVQNSATPDTNDGVIYLSITGGSTPYDITWSNGLKTKNLYNLYPGEYTATVVDFYGDYSATTTCVVESDTFYVDYFSNCSSNELLFLTGLTETNYVEGSIYKFEINEGCWTYSGKTLWSGQTLSTDTQTSGPFETCDECDPPVVLPYYPEQLCLYSIDGVFDARPFEFYGFENDKPAYTGTGVNNSTQTIKWVPGFLNQWVVLGTTGFVLSNTNDTFNPLGGWVLQGTQQKYVAVSGSCPTAPVLSMFITKNDESCDGACDGSIVVTASGGSGVYMCSKDGVNYQFWPTFEGLCDQTLTIYVKDSLGNVVSQNVTINAGPKKTTYKISLQTKQVNTQLNYGTQVSSSLEYVVNVTPELPDGVEIKVPLLIGVQEVTQQPGVTTVSYTPTLSSGSTSVSGITALTNTQVVVSSPYDNIYYPFPRTTKNYSVNYNSLVLKKGLTISGKVETTITKVSDGSQTGCSSKSIYNPTTSTKYYRWVNCSGVTEVDYLVYPEQTVQICARSVTPNSSTNTLRPGNGLIISDGNLNCGGAITDGNVTVTANFNGPSMTDSCSLLQVQTPPSKQLYSQLYQSQFQGNGF